MIDVVITFFANVIISDKLKLWRSGRYMSHYLETGTLCIVKCNIFVGNNCFHFQWNTM